MDKTILPCIYFQCTALLQTFPTFPFALKGMQMLRFLLQYPFRFFFHQLSEVKEIFVKHD